MVLWLSACWGGTGWAKQEEDWRSRASRPLPSSAETAGRRGGSLEKPPPLLCWNCPA